MLPQNPDTFQAFHVALTIMEAKESQPNNPLHGITLAQILEYLVDKYGWEYLGEKVRIRCFTHDPSIKSSLTFLRRTPWARTKVENLYIRSVRKK